MKLKKTIKLELIEKYYWKNGTILMDIRKHLESNCHKGIFIWQPFDFSPGTFHFEDIDNSKQRKSIIKLINDLPNFLKEKYGY